MNMRLLKIASAIGLSCLSLTACVSDGDRYEYSGDRYQRPYYDGPRYAPRHERSERRSDRHRHWDRDDGRDDEGWRGRDRRRFDDEDRGERRGRRYWMEDEG